jgi:hypothetical protein
MWGGRSLTLKTKVVASEQKNSSTRGALKCTPKRIDQPYPAVVAAAMTTQRKILRSRAFSIGKTAISSPRALSVVNPAARAVLR